jgi:predicted nucleic acid-binding protein
VIILDTNVLSAVMDDAPEAMVIHWLDSQASTAIWTTAITVFEIELGLNIMPAGARQTSLRRRYLGVAKGGRMSFAIR